MRIAVKPLVYIAALALGICAAMPAFAAPMPAAAPASYAAVPAPMPMKTLGITSQPVGHYDFCKRYPQQCGVNKGSTAPLALTAKLWRAVSRVNAQVNKKVRAAADMQIYGKEEYWEYPDKAGWFGDCEDYALLKQRMLQKSGIPASALLITVVRKPDGEAHAVLTLRTMRGDYVLDNLRDSVLDWQDTEYSYIKRQSAYHSGLWVAIAPRKNAPVALAANGRKNAGLASTQPSAAP